MLLNLLFCMQAVHGIEPAEATLSGQLHPAVVDEHLGFVNMTPAQIEIVPMACGKVSTSRHFATQICMCQQILASILV